jgi:hypothetical protein
MAKGQLAPQTTVMMPKLRERSFSVGLKSAIEAMQMLKFPAKTPLMRRLISSRM